MTKVPEGLQQHYVWTMDGRTWIESAPQSDGRSLARGIERGWVKPIPQQELRKFLASLPETNAVIERGGASGGV